LKAKVRFSENNIKKGFLFLSSASTFAFFLKAKLLIVFEKSDEDTYFIIKINA